MPDGYDPNKSQVGSDKLSDFLRAQITGDLQEVPGIGPANEKLLKDAGIQNTYQLIGKYLEMKRSENGTLIGAQKHCDDFWKYLQGIGVRSYRSGIILSLGEKVNTLLPGLYDASEFS
jgi:hypothetical protein